MSLPVPEAFGQLRLHVMDPIQQDYEVIRPIVLFAQSVAVPSADIGIDRATVSDHARRFVQQGMLELWELDDHQWRKVIKRPPRHRPPRRMGEQWREQLPLELALVVALLVQDTMSLLPR